MPKVNVYDMSGKEVDSLELSNDIFGVEVNEHVLYEAVKNQLANKRQGTQSTKTRAEVRGGGKKPWRQKGTGRARHGSSRSPIWVGGGVTFGPKPRDYSYKLPKKVKRLALKSALSSKVEDKEIIVLDDLKLEEIKTREIKNILANLNASKKAVIVMDEKDDVIVKSAKNIPNVVTLTVNTLNVYDILNSDSFIITKDAVKKVEEVFA